MALVSKLVSGGQTGVDRAALDVALELGLETGGWVPRGRRAEDGRIPDRYPGLRETGSDDYAERTECNVRDSDATLILAEGTLGGGTAWTLEVAERLERPRLVIDLAECRVAEAGDRVRAWLAATRPGVLNVAGPRASEAPGLEWAAADVLRRALLETP